MQVWAAHLDRTAAEQDRLRATLSADELERAARFRYDRHARRYIAGRGILRWLIGAYLECDAAGVRFRYMEGKPSLFGDAREPLFFNLAHSDDLALFAFTTTTDIGVDVERVTDVPDARDVASGYFSPAEIGEFSRAPDEADAFFRCWTRKEAFIKALGHGLAYPLDQFAVTLLADDRSEVRHVGGDQAEAARWSMRHLEPADGFVGALATRCELTALDCWRWEPTPAE